MTSAHAPRPSAPQALAGRYRLEEPLGEGGMALVVRAFDQELAVPRAVKVMLPVLARRRKLRERFQSEARIMARLDHPHIVRVFDVGVHGKAPYIAMELLPGGSLQSYLEARGPLAPGHAVDVVLDLCAAVAHAHAHGVVHRDIKPHNALVAADGTIKLTDFGIARTDEGKTKTGAAMGTLGYVAPEQLANAKAATPAADVYSLAATLWKLITDGKVERLAYDLGHGALEALPAPLRPVLRSALAQRVEGRTPDVATFERALRKARPHLAGKGSVSLVHEAPATLAAAAAETLYELLGEAPSVPDPVPSPASASPRRAPVPRPPERKGPYVVRLTDEDVQATLEARRARRERADDSEDDTLDMEDRIGSEIPLSVESWWSMGRRVLGGTVRAVAVGFAVLLLAVIAVGALNVADRVFDLRGHRANFVETSSALVDAVTLEGAATVQARQQATGERQEELVEHYLALEEARTRGERAEAAAQFVEVAEEEVAAALPEDPERWSPEQRAEVDRLLRLRAALSAYEEAKEQVGDVTPEG